MTNSIGSWSSFAQNAQPPSEDPTADLQAARDMVRRIPEKPTEPVVDSNNPPHVT